MRSRVALFSLLLIGFFVVFPDLAYAKIPYFGPIIPDLTCGTGNATLQSGAGSWGAFIIVINNIISFLITIAITAAVPLSVAYAGFLYVINPVSPEERHHANRILWTAVVGIIVSLAAYMIVDVALIAVTRDANGNAVGADYWTSLVFGDSTDICLKLAGSLSQAHGTDPTDPGISQSAKELAVRINAFQAAARSAGLNAEFEVGLESRKQELVGAGATGVIKALGGHITGEHFSVYGSGGCGGPASAELKANQSCANCTALAGVSCKAGAGCSVTAPLATAIQQIPTSDAAIGNWLVTEAFPPTTTQHSCSCHYLGTCIDAAFR